MSPLHFVSCSGGAHRRPPAPASPIGCILAQRWSLASSGLPHILDAAHQIIFEGLARPLYFKDEARQREQCCPPKKTALRVPVSRIEGASQSSPHKKTGRRND